MTHIPYLYKRLRSQRYIFVSMGRARIEKVVDLVPFGIGNLVNLGFGDLLPDGSGFYNKKNFLTLLYVNREEKNYQKGFQKKGIFDCGGDGKPDIG